MKNDIQPMTPRRPFLLRNLWPLLLVFGCLCPALAQTPTADITGRVTDATGEIITGAEISATNTLHATVSKSTTNEAGYYNIPLVPPGEYRLVVTRAGFEKVNETVSLAVGQTGRFDFQMTVGNVTQSVEVTGAAPDLDSSTSSLGAVIASQQVENLPLNARDPLRFAYLVPGFTPNAAFQDQFNRAISFHLNGGRGGMNDMFIDGISNSAQGSNQSLVYAVFPSPDSLQEFRVLTNSLPAEFGRVSGGVINMAMRSGTNAFHGVAYEYLRNSALDANDFFSNRAGHALPEFHRSQFGASVSGPVVRNKLFFFSNYEGLRQGQGATFTGTVPTALERQGDFSQSGQLVGGKCQPVQLYDPTTTAPAATGSGYVRDPFPGAVIPPSRFDQVALKVAAYFPAPNTPGAACTGANNFFFSGVNKFNVNQSDSKVDWVANESNRLLTGLSYRRSVLTNANPYGNEAYTDFQSAGFGIPSWGARLNYSHVQSARLVFDLRAGYSTVTQNAPPLVPSGFSLTSLGFPASYASQVQQPAGFPVFTVAGYTSLGQTYTSPHEAFHTGSLAGGATLVIGRHTLKAGFDSRLNQVGSALLQYTSGSYTFDRGFTQGPNPNVSQANLGNGFASFLLGAGTSGFVNTLPQVYTSNFYTGLFVQDDFKVTPKFTLNLGIRNDMETGKSDRFGQLAWFDYSAASPLAAAAGLPNLKGGVRAQGSTAGSQYPDSWNNWGPRAGFAWEAFRNTVIRGGYGILYAPYIGAAAGNLTGTEGFSTQTAWNSSVNGLNPTNYLSNAFPGGLLLPTGNRNGLLADVGQNMTTAIDRASIKSSYVQQWNLTIQRQLPGRIVLETSYAGNKGSRLSDLGWEMNQLTPAQLALGSALQQLVPNPFYGLIPSGPLAGPQITLGQSLRPYPQYLSVTNFRPTSASDTYHSFQMRVQRQFANGASFLAAWTAGKVIDDAEGVSGGAQGLDSGHQNSYDRAAEKAVSPQDVSQYFVASGVYELPFGKAKQMGRNWPSWLDRTLGGWQVNGILTLATGVPLPITTTNTSGSFSQVERPNVSGYAGLSGDRSATAQLAQWFNTAVFSQPAPFTFGNAPRTLPNVRAPGLHQFDFSVFKDFPVREKRKIELRGEFFNLTNTPNWGVPGLVFGSSTFGVISTQANTPRQVQVSLKFLF